VLVATVHEECQEMNEEGKPRIGISLLTLVPGIVGGSETYARELIRALARVGGLRYQVFLPTIATDAADGLPASTVTAYRARRDIVGRAASMLQAHVAPRRVRRELELDDLGAIHFPLTVMLPPLDHPPAVTTVLDLQHELLPQLFSPVERIYRRLTYRTAATRSRLVIAISQHVKETAVERLGLPPERVRVVHLGVDRERFKPGDAPREPFLLYPANNWPHKNHALLVEAFARIRRERPDLRLVLTGSGHERSAYPAGVEVLGRVSDETLTDLYRRASALVFPSLYEGFGQPPLEAMASGCPVAAARNTAIPEVCGDAARYFDPTSEEDLAAAVLDVLSAPQDLVARGLKRAAHFSWDECARGHDAVYREVVGGSLSSASRDSSSASL
jgi:glycosyltransferase involved in cell wall biosynthesis